MSPIRRLARVVRHLALPAVAAAALSQGTAEARPQYLKGFGTTYAPLKTAVESKKCAVCHGMGEKTERNEYGKAVAEGLKAKNVKDEAAVAEALKAAEAKPSGIAGKTFGQLIGEGKLPQ